VGERELGATILVAIMMVHPGKVQVKRESLRKSSGTCCDALGSTPASALLSSEDMFRHTSHTTCSAALTVFFSSPSDLDDGISGGVLSPRDLEGSSPLFPFRESREGEL